MTFWDRQVYDVKVLVPWVHNSLIAQSSVLSAVPDYEVDTDKEKTKHGC